MTLICPVCGRRRDDAHPSQKTCSLRCGRELTRRTRGRDFFVLQSRRNYAAKARANRARAEAQWRARYPEVPVTVARAIYQQGYHAGHRKGVNTGYRKGWADACGETWERSA